MNWELEVDSKVTADQRGHSVDRDQNVCSQANLNSSLEAIRRLENAYVAAEAAQPSFQVRAERPLEQLGKSSRSPCPSTGSPLLVAAHFSFLEGSSAGLDTSPSLPIPVSGPARWRVPRRIVGGQGLATTAFLARSVDRHHTRPSSLDLDPNPIVETPLV